MAEGFGYGQMTPEDAASEFNVIAFIVRQMIARLETTKLVKVVAVHDGGPAAPPPTVDVQPLVSQVDGFNNAVAHGTVFGLPVLRLQAGAAAIILDPKVDDVGFVVVADRDISAAKMAPGEVVTPGSGRKFDLADGIYCGGILNGAPSSYIQFKADGHLKIVLPDGKMLETSATGFAFTGDLNVSGNVNATGNVVSHVGGVGPGAPIDLVSHVHSGVATGGGSSGPPVPGS